MKRAEDEITDLRGDLTDCKDRAERAESTVRELLDRLADHRAGLLDLDEVLAGPMLNQTFDNSSRASKNTLPELWSIARDWTPEAHR